jgi:uncharacterized membrane protein YbhN (UPF0104 family)
LLLAVVGVAVCLVPAPTLTTFDQEVSDLLAKVPASFGGLWQIAYDLMVLWAALLLATAVIAHARLKIVRDMALALGFAIGYLLLAAAQIGISPAELASEAGSADDPGYLATRLAVATALVATASPHVAVALRRVGRWVLAAGALAGIALGFAATIGTIAGALLGIAGAATAHLLFGSPGGRLTLEEVASALGELGVSVTDLTDEPLDDRGVAVVRGRSDGVPVRVRVFGRDARQGQLIASTWSSLRRRGAMPKLGSGWQQVQHEAFVSLFAERAGASVLPVITAGVAVEGDALLILRDDGQPLSALEAEAVTDESLAELWRSFVAMDAAGVAMGRVTPGGLSIRADGTGAIGDFADGGVGVGRADLDADKAQLLTVTALVLGRERAIDVALRTIGTEALERALPYLQRAALDTTVARAVKAQGWDLDELRVQTEQATGSAPRELEQLSRVTWGSIGKLVLIGLVAYALISAISNVGLATIVAEIEAAGKGWLLLGLALSPLVGFPQAVSTRGATLHQVRFLAVLMLQYGIQFIALAVPSSAARVALEIRFFERVGVGAAGAVAIGMIDGVSLFTVQMLLIVIITVSGLASLQLFGSSDPLSTSGPIGWETVMTAFVLLALAFVVAWVIPALRRLIQRFLDGLRKGVTDAHQALRVLRNPRKVAALLGGNLAAQMLLSIILGCSLLAFGYSASLAQLLLIQTFVSLFAGFMPVPGGVGVAEAGYTAGFVAIGVPESSAAAAALMFRLVTFYVPPAWGALAMRWMRDNRYL